MNLYQSIKLNESSQKIGKSTIKSTLSKILPEVKIEIFPNESKGLTSGGRLLLSKNDTSLKLDYSYDNSTYHEILRIYNNEELRIFKLTLYPSDDDSNYLKRYVYQKLKIDGGE